ncbi:MAG: hypothetical protein MUC29_11950 [Pyrinomonadaceae bacterium]|nr:hypothetical protein [Pyrinomonadaceae bacterium]
MIKLLSVCFVIILFSTVNYSVVRTWDGGGADTNLTTAANWVGDVAPTANDDLVFPTNATAVSLNNNFFFFTTFRSVTFQGGTYTIGGNPFNVTAGINVEGGTQTINTAVGLTGGSQTFTHAQGSTTTYAILSLGANTLTFAGDGSGGFGILSGSGSIIKDGLGACLVVSTSNFSGQYTVNNGIFVVDANTPNSNATINGGAMGGTGTIGLANVNVGAISAGTLQSPTGILNTKNLTLTNQGIVAIKIGGTTAGSTGHDQLNVTGTVNLGSSQLAPIAWNNFRPAINDSFTIINNDGTDAINGTFNNLPEGARISALGFAFRISYVGGTGNDVVITRTNLAPFDFDGDGKSDVSIFRNGLWSELLSGNGSNQSVQFGLPTDKIVPADFDGDTKTDVAVYRDGNWYYLRSIDNSFVAVPFGQTGDVPMPNDFDGDGRADVAVFRPSNGVWYQIRSLDNSFFAQQFGNNQDKPLMGDYDGDGRGDLAVFRNDGNWYFWMSATSSFVGFPYGLGTDTPVPADYDGDGKTDAAIYRPALDPNLPDFYILNSSGGLSGASWGVPGDVPVVADYDGDGRGDMSVFRPSTSGWYLLQSNLGFSSVIFGQSSDKLVPNAYN